MERLWWLDNKRANEEANSQGAKKAELLCGGFSERAQSSEAGDKEEGRKMRASGFVRLIGLGMMGVVSYLSVWWLRSAEFNFDPKNSQQLKNRVLTPNGDGLNEEVTFSPSNPFDVQVVLRVFDLQGRIVFEKRSVSGETQLRWNGRDDQGGIVPSGIYLYQLEAEGKIFNGTIIVAR